MEQSLWCAPQIQPFLCQLADLGSHLQYAPLRDATRGLLRLLSSDVPAADKIFSACLVGAKEAGGGGVGGVGAVFRADRSTCRQQSRRTADVGFGRPRGPLQRRLSLHCPLLPRSAY